MFKVLIVDDEPIVREGLKSIIEWEKCGFSVCGEGIDGNDGLEKILEMKPELVLMDIKMPGIYGIDLIKEARSKGFTGKIIILTGYSDFEYAKTAIQLGVKSYLLKPIEEDELTAAVLKIREEIQEEIKMQKFLSNSKKHLKNRIINILVSEESNPEKYMEDMKLCDLYFEDDCYHIASIESGVKACSSGQSFEDFFNEHFEELENILIFFQEERPGLIFKGYCENEVYDIIQKIYKELSKETEEIVYIAIGRCVNDACEFYKAYGDVRKVMDRQFLYEDLKIVAWKDIVNDINACVNSIDSIDIESLYTFIEIGDMEKLNMSLKNLEKLFKQSNLSTEKIKVLCANCFVELKEKIALNYKEYKNSLPKNDAIINKIYDKSSLGKVLEFMKTELSKFSSTISNADSDNIMKKILNYIQKNYSKELKLELLAEIFCYNSSYLGKMFKNFTGENFNSYLDKVRIENAKVLLQDGLKVYEVSEKVGYKSIDYFYSKFKKQVGVSPKEYKKL